MTCKGLARCRLSCLHRQMVVSYQQERERQETAIEDQTELEPSEYALITFKAWLIGNRNGGRHRPPSKRQIRDLLDDEHDDDHQGE